MKIYTAAEIAGELTVSYKSVLNLIRRGDLKALPGLRHKLVTEAEFNRYLGVSNTPNGTQITPAPAKPMCNSQATPSARPARMEQAKDKSPVNPAAKVVASPVAQLSQRKRK